MVEKITFDFTEIECTQINMMRTTFYISKINAKTKQHKVKHIFRVTDNFSHFDYPLFYGILWINFLLLKLEDSNGFGANQSWTESRAYEMVFISTQHKIFAISAAIDVTCTRTNNIEHFCFQNLLLLGTPVYNSRSLEMLKHVSTNADKAK